MSNIKERILQYAKHKGISYEKFCESINMAYSSFKGPGRERAINSDALDVLISKYSDLNPEWLLTGKGSMLRTVEKASEQEEASMGEEENDKLFLKENKHWPEATQRLRTLINRYSNGSVRDFANNLEGVSQQRLSRIFNIDGRTRKYPEVSAAIFTQVIRKFPSISMEWLLTGNGEMLKENDVKKDIVVSTGCSSCQEKDKAIEELKRTIADKDKQIASLQSNMDIIIKAKDELLKAREEMIKQKEELIATQKQHIKELSKNRDLIEEIGVTPVEDTTTLEEKGEMTVIKHIKKGWQNKATPDMTHPPRSK